METSNRRGVGPWVGTWPEDDHFDPELLEHGDYRNVEDQYRYWKVEAIKDAISEKSSGLEIAIENLGHDFNIGSIVRSANALGVSRVHIIGRKRWNRRGAMVTDRYMCVDHFETVSQFLQDVATRNLEIIGIDNIEGSRPLEKAALPPNAVLVFGEESSGLSPQMAQACSQILHITQSGSTRSMNVGHAAAVAMWAWGRSQDGNVGQ